MSASAPGARSRARPRVQSAARALQVLLSIAGRREGRAAKDIAADLDVPRQVVYHLLHTLSSMDAVARDDTGRYRLGLGLAPIAAALPGHASPQARLGAVVEALARATGETAYAVGWVDGDIVVLATASGHNPIKATGVPLGFRGDGHARASGKLLLALAPVALRADYLERNPLRARTATTVVDREALEREFERIRERGWATDHDEFEPGLSCLAVPLAGSPDAFAICLSAPSAVFRERFDAYLAAARAVQGGGVST